MNNIVRYYIGSPNYTKLVEIASIKSRLHAKKLTSFLLRFQSGRNISLSVYNIINNRLTDETNHG